MSTRIEQFTAHPIDHSKDRAVQETIPKDAELDSYLIGLLQWAYEDEDVRQFLFGSSTTETYAALHRIMLGERLSSLADTIANRLLRTEKQTHHEVEHLKGVHEGMLLQAVFVDDDKQGILLAKVDLSEFLRREDFRSERGIDKKHRLLKFCLIEFSDKGEILAVRVGDTNPTIAVYWWKDFLELTERRTDGLNTKVAFAMFDNFLAKSLRKEYPRDYPVLFNEVLRVFKRNQAFKFGRFIDHIFDGYRPCHSNLNVAELKRKARELLGKGKFDANFTILPGEVEKRFKKTYTLTSQIELTVSGEIAIGQISALALDDGTKGVFVKSEPGYEQFPLRNVALGTKTSKTADRVMKKISSSTSMKVQSN